MLQYSLQDRGTPTFKLVYGSWCWSPEDWRIYSIQSLCARPSLAAFRCLPHSPRTSLRCPLQRRHPPAGLFSPVLLLLFFTSNHFRQTRGLARPNTRSESQGPLSPVRLCLVKSARPTTQRLPPPLLPVERSPPAGTTQPPLNCLALRSRRLTRSVTPSSLQPRPPR